jgi:hypothetical protein
MNPFIYSEETYFPFESKYSFIEHSNGFCTIDCPKENNEFIILFLAKAPSFGLVANALEEATYINHITGKPFIRTSILYRILFSQVIINIEFPDNTKLNSIDVSSENLDNINYNLIKFVMKEWLKTVL